MPPDSALDSNAVLRDGSKPAVPNRLVLVSVAALSALVVSLWAFPTVWYTKTDAQLGRFWLTEQTTLPGWTFREIPVSKSAEALLVADRLINGEFTAPDGKQVRVFSAKRYLESQNEIGLFVHTPDRCWTESGWRMEAVQPECKAISVPGVSLVFERRVFVSSLQRELVYFAGVVGGQPLPYRLDHNLSVGMKHALQTAKEQTGTALRASDQRFWTRIWDAFVARRPLTGPKQFIRISTPVSEGGLEQADRLLGDFLPQWLMTVPYDQEIAAWSARRARSD